jgi:hypothetical protein
MHGTCIKITVLLSNEIENFMLGMHLFYVIFLERVKIL